MAFKDYDANFASVLPKLRLREDIVADLGASASGQATTVTQSMLAEIELHIKDGDDYYRRRQFDPALREFKQARALIYKTLHPDFDVGSYLGRKDIALPLSAAIENSLLEVSVRITDVIRPPAPEPRPVWRDARDVIPEVLKPLTATGFRESVGIEEVLQVASAQGVSLLNENKAEAAIDLMEDALARASAPGLQVDPALTAALNLNLSAAYLQLANTPRATALANAALERFRAGKDVVGQAQALHLAGASAHKAGDAAKAKELLTQAADILKQAPGAATPVNLTPVLAAAPVGLTTTFTPRTNLGPIVATIPRVPALRTLDLVSRDFKTLQPIANKDPQKLTFRVPGRADGWGTLSVTDDLLKRQQSKAWRVGVPAGDRMVVFSVGSGLLPSVAQLTNDVYRSRLATTRFKDLAWHIVDPSTTTFYLTHLYAYALPVKIGDCFHELGQYEKAEEYYLIAARYTYLNKEVEATGLWIRLARNAVEWGDALYKDENLNGAKAQYTKLIAENATAPNSFLYTTASLTSPATAARTLIQNIQVRPLPDVNWEIAFNVLTANSRLQQIAQGLDFYGLLLSPIHTFEYLQSVARGFAQEAIQAEREFVNFKTREELEAATRRDLETAKAMAQAEADGRLQQYLAAQEDESAAQKAHELATKRRDDAVTQRNNYASVSSAQIWAQSAAAALGGGEDAYWSEISELADKLGRGETIHGPGPKLAAAQILRAGRKTRDYELKKMQDTIDELTKAIGIAKDQWDAAKRRTAANEIAWQAAVQRAQMADAALDAFDNEFFTPESWGKMAETGDLAFGPSQHRHHENPAAIALRTKGQIFPVRRIIRLPLVCG